MINFLKAVIKPSYWFTHQHPVPDTWVYGLTILFGGILLIGLVASVLSNLKRFKKPYRNVFFQLAVWGWTMSILGFSLLFFSVERVWLISARAFYLVWFAIAVYWITFPIKYLRKDVPRLLERAKEMATKDKYLPRRKK